LGGKKYSVINGFIQLKLNMFEVSFAFYTVMYFRTYSHPFSTPLLVRFKYIIYYLYYIVSHILKLKGRYYVEDIGIDGNIISE